MKIFISYGHNDHIALVNAVCDALKRDGHTIWKDDDFEHGGGVRPSQDHARVIFNEIDDSDFVIAFVTAKTAESLYCCDEREYTCEHKGSRIIQLRLDGVEIKRGCSLSYVDMDTVETSTGQINKEALEAKMQLIYTAFQDPAALLNPSAKFERHLKIAGAVEYAEFVSTLEKDDFVGRQWLKQQCVNWVMDDTIPCRLFVILGEAGTGKTAFVRHLASDKDLVRSVHICVYDRPATQKVGGTLKDLAYTLTTTNAAYYNYLKDKDFTQLQEMSYDGLFRFLFVDPLKNEQEKYLLIIDGLDEMEESEGLVPLIKVFRQYAEKLNPNVSILVTTRPEENIVSLLNTVVIHSRQSVVLGVESGREDLVAYVEKNLLERREYTQALAEQILEACGGNFEYLTLLFAEAKEENLTLSGALELPKGLQGRYTQYLDRRMEKKYGRLEKLSVEQAMLFSVLGMTREPIPLSLLAKITGYDPRFMEDTLDVFGSLLRKARTPEGETLVSFFSKGFRDYLVLGKDRKYRINGALGIKQIAEYVLSNYATDADLQKDPYFDRHGYTHLLVYMATERETVTDYLDRMAKADADKTVLRITNAICAGEPLAVQAYFAKEHPLEVDVIRRLRGRREIQLLWQIADLREHRGSLRSAFLLRGDAEMMNPSMEAYERAESWYHKAREIDEKNLREAPCYESRRRLSVLYERLGDVARAKGTKETAEESVSWYKKKLRLAKKNHRENPCYESRRSLALVYERLGDAANAKGSPRGMRDAKKWYEKKLKLTLANHGENPCYESRRSLVITYKRLGDYAKAKNTPEAMKEAKLRYEERLKLTEENNKENPCYESSRDLAITYARLGEISQYLALEDAEEWYKKAQFRYEELCRENPSEGNREALENVRMALTRMQNKR